VLTLLTHVAVTTDAPLLFLPVLLCPRPSGTSLGPTPTRGLTRRVGSTQSGTPPLGRLTVSPPVDITPEVLDCRGGGRAAIAGVQFQVGRSSGASSGTEWPT
jgi:hypothetical protein